MSESTDRELRYPSHEQISTAVYEKPWAILRRKHDEIRALVQRAWTGEQLTVEEIQARIGAGPARKDTQQVDGVAVLPVYGTITPKVDLFTEISGGTSVQRLQADLRGALADETVTAIVLDVDSPGGLADLLPEFSAELRAAREQKPIVAVVNTLAASAAYWIASQADEVVLSPSGMVGSIGVFSAHDDISGALEQAGVKTTLIQATKSPFKTEGNPYEPLTDEARAEILRVVDECYDLFVADVAAGRRVDVTRVEEDFGKGRILTPGRALRVGMVDRVDTFENTVARLLRASDASNLPPPEEPDPPPLPAPDEGPPEAANSGLSFAARSDAARRATTGLIGSARSLARLTGVKREQLASLESAHRALADEIAELLTEHDPEPHLDASAEAELAWTLSRL